MKEKDCLSNMGCVDKNVSFLIDLTLIVLSTVEYFVGFTAKNEK